VSLIITGHRLGRIGSGKVPQRSAEQSNSDIRGSACHLSNLTTELSRNGTSTALSEGARSFRLSNIPAHQKPRHRNIGSDAKRRLDDC
jgi:hypothetical protein